MKRIALISALVAVSCTPSPERQMDRLLSPLFPSSEPGAAVLVMKGDQVIFDKGYGLANLETGASIDGNTAFNIASVSKQFTAVAVLQLVEEGKISLEDPVSMYFPEFESNIWKEIQIKHLLSHSSGVPDERGYLTREQKIQGDEALATEYLKTLDHRNFAPGTSYEYINPTFVLLGQLVERVSGQAFTDYVQEHVFKPAGMERTVYFDRHAQDPQAAHGYEYADVSDMPEERTAGERPEGPHNWYEYDYGEETFFATRPDGGIYTSTHEFVKWENALRQGSVLSKELLQEAMSPHTVVTDSPWSLYQNRPHTWYGYGWFIESAHDGGPLRIYHTGDNGGFKILAVRYPEKDALLLVFANRADWDRYELMLQIENIILQ
ncbi:MAG: beta-lactamase family protein [Bacteroidales bacterium]|nr:beta-lactamase family protein [Bacteroidales bacterium]MBQ9194510.1 beta-lactamase family protein [Bacteroidales bacterium]